MCVLVLGAGTRNALRCLVRVEGRLCGDGLQKEMDEAKKAQEALFRSKVVVDSLDFKVDGFNIEASRTNRAIETLVRRASAFTPRSMSRCRTASPTARKGDRCSASPAAWGHRVTLACQAVFMQNNKREITI